MLELSIYHKSDKWTMCSYVIGSSYIPTLYVQAGKASVTFKGSVQDYDN